MSAYWPWDDFWPYFRAMDESVQRQAAIALDLENHLTRLGDESQVVVLRSAPDPVLASMFAKGVIKNGAIERLEKMGRLLLMPITPTAPLVKNKARVSKQTKTR